MGIYSKLQKCRVDLQNMNLKKSGYNKFSGYYYYELGDFLPKLNELMLENKMCSVVSFTDELATLNIIDTEDKTQITFTSPMATAELKGCHEIQNLGAVQTYQRRYLYLNAFEIVESDALNGVTGKAENKTESDYKKTLVKQKVVGNNQQDEDNTKITEKDGKQLYAISKANVNLIKEVAKEYGYEDLKNTQEILVKDFKNIKKDIEIAIKSN